MKDLRGQKQMIPHPTKEWKTLGPTKNWVTLQGYLAHKKTRPPGTLQ